MRRTDRETWQRLLLWDRGQPLSERLAADVLDVEGFTSIDPAHPLGGPDGLKDVVLTKDGRRWIAAAYFPNGQKQFKDVRKKFTEDFEGVKANEADAFVFVTNQELSLGERAELEDLASNHDCEIYHLERVRLILDSLRGLRLRQRYLDIPATEVDTLAAVGVLSSLVNAAASMRMLPTPHRDVTLELPVSAFFSTAELARLAEQQGQYELHRGYVLIRELLPALSNPEHPAEPFIAVENFPDALANCHRLTHEAAMLTLLLHRCIGLQHTERLNNLEREQISRVIERLWRCAIRLRPVMDECQLTLLMVGSNKVRAPCAHMAVQMCSTHLLQELLQASEQTGYTSGGRALSEANDEDPLPYKPEHILTKWTAVVDSLSHNSTVHEGFWLLTEAFRDISAEIVRAARYERGLPIVPAWMTTPD